MSLMAGHIDDDESSLEEDPPQFGELYPVLKDLIFTRHNVARTSLPQSTVWTTTGLQNARITSPPAPLELRQNNPQDCSNLIIASVNSATVEISRTIIALSATFSQQLQQASIDASNSVESAQNSASSAVGVAVRNADIATSSAFSSVTIANLAMTSISSASASDVSRLSVSLTLLQANVASLRGLPPSARTITASGPAASQAQPLPTVGKSHTISLTTPQAAAIIVGTVFLSILLSFAIYFLIMRMRKRRGRDSFLEEKGISRSPRRLHTRLSSTARTGNGITLNFNPRTSSDPSVPWRSSIQLDEVHPTMSAAPSGESSQTVISRPDEYIGNPQLWASTAWPLSPTLSSNSTNVTGVSSNKSPSPAPVMGWSPSYAVRQVNPNSSNRLMPEIPERFPKLKTDSNPVQRTQKFASGLPRNPKSSLPGRSPNWENEDPFNDSASRYSVEEYSEDSVPKNRMVYPFEDQYSEQTMQDSFNAQGPNKIAKNSFEDPVAKQMVDDKHVERVHPGSFKWTGETSTSRDVPQDEVFMRSFGKSITERAATGTFLLSVDDEVDQLLEDLTESQTERSTKGKMATEQLTTQPVFSNEPLSETHLAARDALVNRAMSPTVLQKKTFVRETSPLRDEPMRTNDTGDIVAPEQSKDMTSWLRWNPFAAAVEKEVSSSKPLQDEGDMTASPQKHDTNELITTPSDFPSTTPSPLPRLRLIPAEPEPAPAHSRDVSLTRTNTNPNTSPPLASEITIPTASHTAAKRNNNTQFSNVLSKFQNLETKNPSDRTTASTQVTQRAIAGIHIPGSLREQAVKNLSTNCERADSTVRGRDRSGNANGGRNGGRW